MKKFYWLLCVCCLTTMFMACSDDDEELGGGNNQEGIWPENVRKIRRIAEIDEDGFLRDLINFEYAGNVVKNVNYNWSDIKLFAILTFGVSDVEIYSRDWISKINLEEGKIMQGRCNIYAGFDSCYCSYENDYLKQMIVKKFRDYSLGGEIIDYQYDFTYMNDCLAEEKCVEKEEGKEVSQEFWKYTYTETVKNNANIDLLVFLTAWDGPNYDFYYFDDEIWFRMFGLFGNHSKRLPTSINYSSSKGDTKDWGIAYVLDDEGYPVKIKIKDKKSGEEYGLQIFY